MTITKLPLNLNIMLTKPPLVILVFAVALVSVTCNRVNHNKHFTNDSTGFPDHIRLSRQEAEKLGLQFGHVTEIETLHMTSCPGYLTYPQESLIRVAAPASGIVRSLHCSSGDYVEAGALLATLENIDILKLEQEYLEAVNQLEYMREEYRRQGELTVENATSVKRMQVARRDYQSAEIKRNALRTQLQTYGIFADSVKSDQLTSSIDIRAPGSGHITEMNFRPGSFADIGDVILVMCSEQRLLLKLTVPEQNLRYLHKGMSVDFFMPPDSLFIYSAKLLLLTHRIDPKNHTAAIYADPVEQNDDFIPGMSVIGRIKTSGERIKAVPSEAILHTAGGDYLFMMNSGMIYRIPARAGDSIDGFTTLRHFPWNDKTDSLIINGGQQINAFFENR